MSATRDQVDKSIANYLQFTPLKWNSSSDRGVIIPFRASASEDSREVFKRLVREWKSETAHLSQTSKRLQHPAFRAILDMGKSAVPMILDEIERDPDHWFYALSFLTGANPIPNDFSGTVEDALGLWVRWGKEKYAKQRA